jgi:hypothetical protein
MTPHELNRLLQAASTAPVPPAAKDRARTVWESISRGWDPEEIEWQRWLRRWWPWAALTVVVVTGVVAEWPHGRHSPDLNGPPAMKLFQEPAGGPELAAQP